VPRSARSRSLSLDEIVVAALDILRESGLDGLTMRAVAARLGVTPMAVYHYVDDKEDLLRLAVARVSEAWGPLELRDGDWEETLRQHLLSLWRELTRYPGLGTYMIGQPSLGVTPESMAIGIRFFEDAGFTPQLARLAWSFAMTYVHGRISVDARLSHRPDAPRMDRLRAADFAAFGVDAVIAGLRSLRESDPVIAARA
jgi:TetR/AcrR family tetracycline transcriptional repressor